MNVSGSLGVTGILQVTVHKVDGLGQVDSKLLLSDFVLNSFKEFT